MDDLRNHCLGSCRGTSNFKNPNCNFCNTSSFSTTYYSDYKSKPRVQVDFINGTIKYNKKYWECPKASLSNIRIVNYIGVWSKKKVERKIANLNSNMIKLNTVSCKAVNQFYLFNYVLMNIKKEEKRTRRTETKKHLRLEQMLVRVSEDIKEYENHYSMLKLYQKNIKNNIVKYENKMKIIEGLKICCKCFTRVDNSSAQKVKNKYYLCKDCNENVEHECMICIESFKMCSMTLCKCGNGHKTCNSCYETLKNYSDKCPMCRGEL